MKPYILILLFVLSSSARSSSKDKIFIQNENPENGRLLIIEEDEHSVYAYLIKEDRQGIEFDGFVCSVTDPFNNTIDLEKYMESGYPPPSIEKYANMDSYVKGLKTEDISIHWGADVYIEIYINKVKYLYMDLKEKTSYSRSLKMDGPYGKALND